MSLLSAFKWLLVLLIFAVTAVWLWQQEDYIALEIQAHDVPELAERVFAQFVYTQTFVLHDMLDAQRIIVPMFVPKRGMPFLITLRQDGVDVSKWLLSREYEGVVEVPLEFENLQRLTGSYELVFDGGFISHEEKGDAPGLFIETADASYPDGNYRVAENEKEGDISLRVEGRRRAMERLWERWIDRPLEGVLVILKWFLVVVLLSSAPEIVRNVFYTIRRTS